MTDPAEDEDKIDPEGFVRELIAAMGDAGVEGPYTFDTKTGIFGDEERGQIDVRQLYLSLGALKKWQRDGALKKVASYYVERPQMPTDWGYARPRIVLTLVPRMAEEAYNLQHLEKPEPLPIARITPHLAFGLGFPISLGTMNVTLENVTRWSVTPDYAFSAVIDSNTSDHIGPIPSLRRPRSTPDDCPRCQHVLRGMRTEDRWLVSIPCGCLARLGDPLYPAFKILSVGFRPK